jgi:hypothetical protein
MPSSSAAAYGGDAGGWIQERFLRQRRYLPDISLSAESGEVITATITLTTFQEALNDYVTADEAITLECVLYDDNGLEVLVTSAHLGATTGTEISTTDQPRLFVTTNSSGVAVVEITDLSASTVTYHLVVRPLNVPGFPGYAAAAFAA